MHRRLFCTSALAAMLAAVPAWAQQTVNIGLALPLSGPSADYVKRNLVTPTMLAVKEVNDAGGLLGRKVVVIAEDSRTDPTSAVSALRKLIDIDKVLAVFSAYTPLVLPQIPVAEDKEVILIAPSTEHPDVTKSRWTLRMTATADKAGLRIARAAADMQYKTAVTLAEDTEAVRLTDRAFRAEFEKRGGKILASETYKREDTDLRGQLTKLKAANADIVYLMASSGRPLALALRQLRETGMAPKQIFAMNTVDDVDVKALSPDLTNGIIFASLRVDPDFAQRYKAQTGNDADANVGKHYDATRMLFTAIERARSVEPAKVRDALYSFGEYKGVLGTFVFAGSGEPNILPVLMVLKDNKAVPYSE